MWTGVEQTTSASMWGKMKAMVVAHRKRGYTPSPLFIEGAAVEMVSSLKQLGVHISNDLRWAINTASIMKKATNAFTSSED